MEMETMESLTECLALMTIEVVVSCFLLFQSYRWEIVLVIGGHVNCVIVNINLEKLLKLCFMFII